MSACNGKNGSVIFLTRLCVSATITEADFFYVFTVHILHTVL